MRIIIFGLGSMGSRHARVLLKNFKHEIFAFRSAKKLGQQENQNSKIKELYSWKEVKAVKADVAFITNPTFLHIETASKCAALGMHIFMEKPLASSMRDISRLESLCKKKKLTCYTAYCLRFHPVINKLKALLKGKVVYAARVICSTYLPEWRRRLDWRKAYSCSRDSGGGVLLDLSHEFDYIQYLFGKIKKLQGRFGRVSNITIDAEDYADLLLETGNSIPINLHLDFFSRINERSIKIDFKGGYLEGNLQSNRVKYFYNGKRRTFLFKTGRDEYLRDQASYFFKNLRKDHLMNNLTEAKQLLRMILEFRNG